MFLKIGNKFVGVLIALLISLFLVLVSFGKTGEVKAYCTGYDGCWSPNTPPDLKWVSWGCRLVNGVCSTSWYQGDPNCQSGYVSVPCRWVDPVPPTPVPGQPTSTPGPPPPGSRKAAQAVIAFEDLNQDGIWQPATEKRLSPSSTCTSGGAGGSKYVPGLAIDLQPASEARFGDGYMCDTGTSEGNKCACNTPGTCTDANGNTIGCNNQWNCVNANDGVNPFTCLNDQSCHGGCNWQGNSCYSDHYWGTLCTTNIAYCTDGNDMNLRVGPWWKKYATEGQRSVSASAPGWAATTSQPVSYWNGSTDAGPPCSSNVIAIGMRCVESVSCTPACGQALSCGGNCARTNMGAPGQVQITYPLGSAVAPIGVASTKVTLTWSNNEAAFGLRINSLNPDFELGNTNGWAASAYINQYAAIDGNTWPSGQQGRYYLKMARVMGGDSYVVSDFYDTGANVSGRTFTVSFMAKSHEAPKTVDVELQTDSAGGWVQYHNYVDIVQDSWTYFEKTVTIGNHATNNLRIVLRPPNDTWPVYFDDLRIRENTTAHSKTTLYEVEILNSGTGSTVFTGGVTSSEASIGFTGPSGNVYKWHTRGVNDTCSSAGFGNDYNGAWSNWGYFTLNSPPVFTNLPPGQNLRIMNNGGVLVPIENTDTGVSGNHICQTNFNGSRVVLVSVTGTDADGGTDIDRIQVRANGSVWSADANNLSTTPTYSVSGAGWGWDPSGWGGTLSTSGNSRTVTFPLSFPASLNSGNLRAFEVNITDTKAATTGWVNSNRYFKIWDCQVPVTGTIYDGSDVAVPSCPNFGFTNAAGVGMSFSGVGFTSVPSGSNQNAAATSANTYSTTLLWPLSYLTYFGNNFNGSTPTRRITDVNTGTVSCSGWFDQTPFGVNPYTNNPTARIDFSSIMNQAAWYQVVGAGIGASVSLTDSVPPTCVQNLLQCTPAISINSATSSDGLVYSPTITNNSGCSLCINGSPRNASIRASVLADRVTYSNLYQSYNQKLGLGKVYSVGTSLSQVVSDTGGTGVVFVNGNLTVNANNTLSVGDFLMVVASGNIVVSPTVTRMEGIYLANQSFSASGSSATQLQINGMIYSVGDMTLTRQLTPANQNNLTPAVRINYRPDLIINSPPELVRVLSGFKEGI